MRYQKVIRHTSMSRCIDGCRLWLIVTALAFDLGHSAAAIAKDWRPFKPEVMRYKDEGLTCTPKLLRRGDVLTIKFLIPHGGDSGFIDPSGEFIYSSFNEPNPMRSARIWEHGELSKTATLEIPTDTFIGDSENQYARKLFRYRGIYLFRVSRALDSEEEPVQGSCFVRFLAGPPSPVTYRRRN